MVDLADKMAENTKLGRDLGAADHRGDGVLGITKRALERRTGARGLRSIIEASLLDIMFDLPSLNNVHKVVVDESAVTGDGKPLLIYSDPPKVASGQQ